MFVSKIPSIEKGVRLISLSSRRFFERRRMIGDFERIRTLGSGFDAYTGVYKLSSFDVGCNNSVNDGISSKSLANAVSRAEW